MKLHEIIKKLTEKKPDGSKIYTQTSLAVALGTNQSTVGQMLGGNVWDDHWDIILNLIPIAMRHDLLTDSDLQKLVRHDERANPGSPTPAKKTSKITADSR